VLPAPRSTGRVPPPDRSPPALHCTALHCDGAEVGARVGGSAPCPTPATVWNPCCDDLGPRVWQAGHRRRVHKARILMSWDDGRALPWRPLTRAAPHCLMRAGVAYRALLPGVWRRRGVSRRRPSWQTRQWIVHCLRIDLARPLMRILVTIRPSVPPCTHVVAVRTQVRVPGWWPYPTGLCHAFSATSRRNNS